MLERTENAGEHGVSKLCIEMHAKHTRLEIKRMALRRAGSDDVLSIEHEDAVMTRSRRSRSRSTSSTG